MYRRREDVLQIRNEAERLLNRVSLVDWADCDSKSKYYSVLVYDRKLTKEETQEYELDLIDVVEDIYSAWEE